MKSWIKKVLVPAVSVCLTASLTLASLAGAQEITAETAGQQGVAAGTVSEEEFLQETRSSYSVKPGSALMDETGLTWKEWNKRVEEQKQIGLLNQISEDQLRNAQKNLEFQSSPAAETAIMKENGVVNFLDVTALSGENSTIFARNGLEAYQAVYRFLSVLGGKKNTDLLLQKQIKADGLNIFVFQQVYCGETVMGSIVRLTTDAEGKVTAIASSLAQELPEERLLIGLETDKGGPIKPGPKKTDETKDEALTSQESEDLEAENPDVMEESFVSDTAENPDPKAYVLVDAQAAEEAVSEYLREQGITAQIFPEYTEQVLIPVEGDKDTEEDYLPDILYWVVYSENTAAQAADLTTEEKEENASENAAAADSADEPGESASEDRFTAHYVTANGIRHYGISVKNPGDEAARAGSRAAYVFDNMVEDSYTGVVTLLNGSSRELTLPVMKDKDSGMYYLGDVNRRIAVADYYTFDFDWELNLVSSEDNSGWREDDLLTYANYIAAWDFYARLGWTGPDGCETPSLLLRDLCFEDGLPMDNAAYCGNYRGWQIFGYDNSTYYFGEALDVMAHEFTHCVTETSMGFSFYENDYGSINEALSDIMAAFVEMEEDNDEEGFWLVGEDTTAALRSMINPHESGQPEYVWDLFYAPYAYLPGEANDYGGVHTNSSLLNYLAARLCVEGNMTMEEATGFWMMTICGLTPRTDYAQLVQVMRRALSYSGNQNYGNVLERLMDEEKLTVKEIPGSVEEGRALVTLTLPETEALKDKDWVLMGFQLDLESFADIYEVFSALGEVEDPTEEDAQAAGLAITDILSHMVLSYNSWVSDENGNIHMLIKDMPAVYVLVNMNTDGIFGAAVLIGNDWYDVSSLLKEMDISGADTFEEQDEAVISVLLKSGLELGSQIVTNLLFSDGEETVREGSHIILSGNGLERLSLDDKEEQKK